MAVIEVLVPAPAVGTEWLYTITNSTLELKTVRAVVFKLTADGNTGNRNPTVVVNDSNGLPVFTSIAMSTLIASHNQTYQMYQGTDFNTQPSANSSLTISFPEVPLLNGFTIRSANTGLKAGDQFSNIILIGDQ